MPKWYCLAKNVGRDKWKLEKNPGRFFSFPGAGAIVSLPCRDRSPIDLAGSRHGAALLEKLVIISILGFAKRHHRRCEALCETLHFSPQEFFFTIDRHDRFMSLFLGFFFYVKFQCFCCCSSDSPIPQSQIFFPTSIGNSTPNDLIFFWEGGYLKKFTPFPYKFAFRKVLCLAEVTFFDSSRTNGTAVKYCLPQRNWQSDASTADLIYSQLWWSSLCLRTE